MAKYVYPAVFVQEKKGQFSVSFPDIDGCFTCGDDIAHAIEMAKDALALMLYHMERAHQEPPALSDINTIKTKPKQFTSYVACDTDVYRRKHNNRAVKKTLSIPEWLNEEAMEQGVNFSQVLQDGLKTALGLV